LNALFSMFQYISYILLTYSIINYYIKYTIFGIKNEDNDNDDNLSL
jgi:hypothetical protein